mgnify:CR=1 FL=1
MAVRCMPPLGFGSAAGYDGLDTSPAHRSPCSKDPGAATLPPPRAGESRTMQKQSRNRRPNRTSGGGAPRKRAASRRRPPQTPTAANDPQQRLQKILASAGIASRRECEQLILEGRVEVDGEVVTELGSKADPSKQEIRVDGEALPKPKRLYFAVHKPAGVVCTARDPAGRPRVVDMLPAAAGRVDATPAGNATLLDMRLP